jgi:hypothetical protein
MNKFMAIVKKDWQLHRRAILMQAWLVLGMWALTALAGTIIYFSILHYHPERIDISSSNFSLMWESMNNIVIYGLNFYQVILPTLMGLIFSISILIGALNSDMRHNCEIFYRTQPVSLWWRAASKYKVGLFFTLALPWGSRWCNTGSPTSSCSSSRITRTGGWALWAPCNITSTCFSSPSSAAAWRSSSLPCSKSTPSSAAPDCCCCWLSSS